MSKKAALITIVFSLTFAVTSLMSPSQAQEKNSLQKPVQALERFGVGLNSGLNNIGIPFLGVVFSYRTPFFDNQLSIIGQHDFHFNSHTPISNATWLGIHQDFYSNPDVLNTRVYGRLVVGGIELFNPGQPGPNNSTIWRSSWIPALQVGMGGEIQIAGPLKGVMQISSGFPILLRTELGMRLAF